MQSTPPATKNFGSGLRAGFNDSRTDRNASAYPPQRVDPAPESKQAAGALFDALHLKIPAQQVDSLSMQHEHLFLTNSQADESKGPQNETMSDSPTCWDFGYSVGYGFDTCCLRPCTALDKCLEGVVNCNIQTCCDGCCPSAIKTCARSTWNNVLRPVGLGIYAIGSCIVNLGRLCQACGKCSN